MGRIKACAVAGTLILVGQINLAIAECKPGQVKVTSQPGEPFRAIVELPKSCDGKKSFYVTASDPQAEKSGLNVAYENTIWAERTNDGKLSLGSTRATSPGQLKFQINAVDAGVVSNKYSVAINREIEVPVAVTRPTPVVPPRNSSLVSTAPVKVEVSSGNRGEGGIAHADRKALGDSANSELSKVDAQHNLIATTGGLPEADTSEKLGEPTAPSDSLSPPSSLTEHVVEKPTFNAEAPAISSGNADVSRGEGQVARTILEESAPQENQSKFAPDNPSLETTAHVAKAQPVQVQNRPTPEPQSRVPLGQAFLPSSDVDPQLLQGKFADLARSIEDKKLQLKATSEGSLAEVPYRSKNVLDHLAAASNWAYAGSRKRSLEHFNAADESLVVVESKGVLESSAKMAGAVLLNDNVLDYVPSPAESVLINFNKAIMYWSLNDREGAKVEFNRSQERMDRAVSRYEKEIGNAGDKADKDTAAGVEKASKSVLNINPEMARWNAYSGYANPAVAYVDALFNQDDVSYAENMMGRAAGMQPENQVIAKDLAELSQGRLCDSRQCTWVMVEYGNGPKLTELRTDVPISVANGFYSVSLALPKLEVNSDVPNLVLAVNGAPVSLETVGSMDRVVQAEFLKRWPGVVGRSLLSGTIKAVAQKQAVARSGSFGSLVSLASTAATVVSTRADTRIWTEMPKAWVVARVDQSRERELNLSVGNKKIPLTPQLDKSVLFVRVPTDGSAPSVYELPL